MDGGELRVGEADTAHDGALAETFVYAVNGALGDLAPLVAHYIGVEGELKFFLIYEIRRRDGQGADGLAGRVVD